MDGVTAFQDQFIFAIGGGCSNGSIERIQIRKIFNGWETMGVKIEHGEGLQTIQISEDEILIFGKQQYSFMPLSNSLVKLNVESYEVYLWKTMGILSKGKVYSMIDQNTLRIQHLQSEHVEVRKIHK